MRERILKVMEHENLSPSKFAESIGIQRSAMSHIISGRNNPSLDVLLKIIEKFTYVDSDWLLLGKGNMIRGNNQIIEPDLFTNVPINSSNPTVVSENRKEIGLQIHQNHIKESDIEKVTIKEVVSRNVTKIMIFYSDNTFDTFTPEKK